MRLVRVTRKTSGLPVFFDSERTIAIDAGGSVVNPSTMIYIDAGPTGPLEINVQESAEEVAEKVGLATMPSVVVQHEPCPVNANTMGIERPCEYARGHTGGHSWEES